MMTNARQTQFRLRPATLLAIMVSIVCGVAIGVTGHIAVERAGARPPQDLHGFEEMLGEIRENYVEPRTQTQLLDSAIQGVMSGLDPHSAFLDEKALLDLTELTTGHFGGIGVELTLDDGEITIIAPIDDTPAERAGLIAGDVLERIDGTPVHGTTIGEASDALRGEPGTSVTLAVRRDGMASLLDFQITRAAINLASVRSRFLEPGYGYVRISQFQTDTGVDLVKAIDSLQGEHGPLRGLVLDLRNNPGGVLQASVDVADAFLNDGDGLIVYTEGRLPSTDLQFAATGTDLIGGAPLVVLINKGSASAAEIVAGALQDHKRALVLGSTSYGKGSVQAVLPLEHQRALKLTTALYYTPNGRSIQSTGIHPDLEFDADATDDDGAALLAEAVRQLKERRRA
jgi:carboxyl-terminal processing protease